MHMEEYCRESGADWGIAVPGCGVRRRDGKKFAQGGNGISPLIGRIFARAAPAQKTGDLKGNRRFFRLRCASAQDDRLSGVGE